MGNEYWAKRQLDEQNKISNRNIKQTEKQLLKQYRKTMNKVIDDFEATYDKILATVADGKEPTPADLYKLDRYWKMQASLRAEAEKLGDMQVQLLGEAFENEWYEIYNSIALPSDVAYSTISTANASAFINSAWLADGKTFSQRVWNNMNKLIDTLNENLVNCVVTGKSTRELRDLLKDRFKVSISQANTLIRTEIAHIQVEASKQRYMDYGLKRYEYFADTDDKTCRHHSANCKDLDGQTFLYSEMRAGVNAPPMHPNCRCAILPVIE